jgi:UDP-N-acetylmuramoyl-tripeptide--D-alanyl-D-alanine ligase
MEERTLDFVTQACEGTLVNGSPTAVCRRVSTDSRSVQKGDLFFAIPGERFDGHEFLEDAGRKGAVATVVESKRRPRKLGACGLISVDDSRKALGRLGARYRRDFEIPVIAIAGSNGKTTTKELAAAVLKQKFKTLSSEASFNNDIGVPATLLQLGSDHEAAVLEVGTNHPGELGPLVEMIRPKMGVITSIGREHLEFFGDLEGVAREEGKLAELLPSSGKLFLNGEDSRCAAMAHRTAAEVAYVGFKTNHQWRAENLRPDKTGAWFEVKSTRSAYDGDYRVNLLGRHQVINALFAIAIGSELGLNRAEIERGLASCPGPKMRLELSEFNGVSVLDDTYNANTDSVAAALQTLKDFPCKGRRVAVLGDMAELGTQSEWAHEEIGRQAAESGVGQLFSVGKWASAVTRGARVAGLTRVIDFAEIETAAAAIKSFLKPGDVVLLKASRASRLERVGELLRGPELSRKN